MQLELIQINGNKINLLDCENPELIQKHFDDSSSQAHVILKIINSGFYGIFSKKGYSTVMDVGANIGLFSLFVQPVCKLVFAFEPTPSHFEILKMLCKPFQNIHPINAALALESGKAKFSQDTINSTSNHLNNQGDIEVDTLGFNEIHSVIPLQIDYMKMDIEGYENVLRDGLDFDDFPNIRSIYMEIHHPSNLSEQRHKWLDKLKSIGYFPSIVNTDGIIAHKINVRSNPS